eukprot:gene32110-54536_t
MLRWLAPALLILLALWLTLPVLALGASWFQFDAAARDVLGQMAQTVLPQYALTTLALCVAVALGVAVYITKMPLPFMNKNLPRSAEDPADAKKMKEWDPNAGLPGRQTKPEAAPPSDAPAAPAAPAEVATPATPAAPAAAAPPAKSADPLGELARSRAEAPAPASAPSNSPSSAPARPAAPAVAASSPAVASTEPFQYFVQAGAYRSLEDAEQQRAKLSLMGLQSKLSERDQAGRM